MTRGRFVVPMPLPVKSRRYDEQFWKEVMSGNGNHKRSKEQNLKELGFYYHKQLTFFVYYGNIHL